MCTCRLVHVQTQVDRRLLERKHNRVATPATNYVTMKALAVFRARGAALSLNVSAHAVAPVTRHQLRARVRDVTHFDIPIR